MTAFDPVTLALHRFALGPKPGERAALGSDPRGWLLTQLQPQPIPEALRDLPPIAEAMKLMPAFLRKQFMEARKQAEADPAMAEPAAEDGVEKRYRQVMQKHILAEVLGRFAAAAESSVPLHERLVRFWANHFTVSGTKPAAYPLVGAFEREAIRPHVTGRFVDLLMATSLHPAMLIYLDNSQSVGPASRNGLRREKGLNENLAREILELHTLGVSGGYSQADVTAFANALTGHGSEYGALRSGDGGYVFAEARHQPGAQTVLGRSYPQAGAEQAKVVLRDLARHPSTARFIATKLVRHFIADVPPPALVARLEQSFIKTDGDLQELTRALITSPEAFDTPATQFRTPELWLIASQRLLGSAVFDKPQQLVGAMQQLGQAVFRAPSPAGWPDDTAAWLTGDALWKRLETALAIASRSPVDDPMALAEAALGESLSATTRDTLRGAETAPQAVALLLASPEFNRR